MQIMSSHLPRQARHSTWPDSNCQTPSFLNLKLKKKFDNVYDDLSVHAGHTFGLVATQAAYDHGDDYVDQMMDYLAENLHDDGSIL
jgi:hypothetical protein